MREQLKKFAFAKRELEGKTIYAQAGEMGINPTTYSGIITKRVNPNSKELKAICEYLKLPPDELFPGEGFKLEEKYG